MNAPDRHHSAPTGSRRPRPDLAIEIVDGDVCIYDPVSTTCHVLSGGAVLVWDELAAGGLDDIGQRVADRAGVDPAEIADDVASVVDQLDSLGLLTDGGSCDPPS